MKRFITFLCAALMVAATAFAKGEKQTVVFDVDLHCQGCINKIEKNIAFEKGVKDLRCDLATKTVTVVFDSEKTSVEKLQKAFEAIGKPAKVHVEGKACQHQCGGQCQHDGSCQHQATTGATTPGHQH